MKPVRVVASILMFQFAAMAFIIFQDWPSRFSGAWFYWAAWVFALCGMPMIMNIVFLWWELKRRK